MNGNEDVNSVSVDSSFRTLYLGKRETVAHGIDDVWMCNILAYFKIYGKESVDKKR